MDFARIAALILVAGITGLLWWAAKQRRKGVSGLLGISINANNILSKNRGNITSSRSRVAVLQRTQLTATHHLHTISAGEETILLCTYPGGCCTISRGLPLSSDSEEQAPQYASRHC